ncbi:MAG TPA: geranylgeranyl reductase family protein [Bacteroidia bacterium]|nr:geranylgeranyl reductase family protein [Bacteroidia bacterium]HNT79670.1 geranylgeranyl reductase family protein [Bacteroidia bacterium]
MKTEVLIIGAGPAGCSAAYTLGKAGVDCVLVDKAVFPRDKICGDGLSGYVKTMMTRLDEDLFSSLSSFSKALPSYGVRFVSPSGIPLDIPFNPDSPYDGEAAGYVCKRIDFDDLLFNALNKFHSIKCITGKKAMEVNISEQGVGVELEDKTKIESKIIIVSTGAQSVFGKKISGYKQDKKCFIGGVRSYYSNVEMEGKGNYIELHFLNEYLPGYFWIFPLSDNLCNVGAGIRSDVIGKKKINLSSLLLDSIQNNESLKNRFKNAMQVDPIKGFGLPLGSKRMKVSGDRYFLAGDAASLIDPFTGEGIGNAMRSGIMSAEESISCLNENNFSATRTKAYDQKLFSKIGKELKLSTTMQSLLKYPWLFNKVAKKASRNKELRDTISAMMTDFDIKARLKEPSFYFKILFG